MQIDAIRCTISALFNTNLNNVIETDENKGRRQPDLLGVSREVIKEEDGLPFSSLVKSRVL